MKHHLTLLSSQLSLLPEATLKFVLEVFWQAFLVLQALFFSLAAIFLFASAQKIVDAYCRHLFAKLSSNFHFVKKLFEP
jgi:hypothetical protein